jgi:exosortase
MSFTPASYIEMIIKKNYRTLTVTFFGTLLVLVFLPTWRELIEFWYTNDDYNHGFLVLPISLYLCFRFHRLNNNIPVDGSSWGLLFLIFSILIYITASFAGINTLAYLSIVMTVFSLTLYIFGSLHVRSYLFPIFFLIFMIPVPAQIFSLLTIPLQLFVSTVSCEIARFFSIPVLREGNIIHIPGYTLQVVHACSGLRSLVSILMICALFGYMALTMNALRVALCLFAVPVAIFVNIFRVTVMIALFYFFDIDVTTETVHTFFGVAVFLLALIAIFCFRGFLSRWERRS